MGRPALIVLLFFALGIVSAPLVPIGLLGWLIVVAFLLLMLSLLTHRHHALIALCAVGLATLCAGLLSIRSQQASYDATPLSRLASLRARSVSLVGRVSSVSDRLSERVFVLALDSLAIRGERPLHYPAKLLAHVPIDTSTRLLLPESGDRVRCYATLFGFADAQNPYEYPNERKQQSVTQTEAQAFIRSPYDLYVTGHVDVPAPSRLSAMLDAMHHHVTALLDTAIQDREARGFIEAVVLGDRNDMTPATLDDFTTAGVAHILAVSGFNVAIIALVLSHLLRVLGLTGHRTRILLTMLGVALYAGIVGLQPSVVRALVMIELVLLARWIERRPEGLNILAGAAAAELLWSPSDLFDVSFQLSYAAVAGLVIIQPRLVTLFVTPLDRRPQPHPSHEPTTSLLTRLAAHLHRVRYKHWPPLRRALLLAFVTSVAATLASYPVITAHFFRISFIGLLVNLPMIPLASLITSLGFLLIPITAGSTWLGVIYGEATTYLSKGLLWMTHVSASLPRAAGPAAAPTIVALCLYTLALLYVIHAKTKRHLLARCGAVMLLYGFICLADVPLTHSVLQPEREARLQVLFFDVGQGDCIYLRTPTGQHYLMDLGPVGRSGAPAIDRTVLPFLRAESATNIRAAIITHMHRDHYGGAVSLLQHAEVGTIYTCGERVRDPLTRALDSLRSARPFVCQALKRGDTLHLDPEVTLYVLQPDARATEHTGPSLSRTMNSASLAVRVVYRKTSLLLLGDVERSEEESMLRAYGPFLRSDVVKVAHHGSAASSSKAFVSAAAPRFAVISVGEHNSFGHPAPEVVRRWWDAGATILRTDRDGAILLASDGHQVRRLDWHR